MSCFDHKIPILESQSMFGLQFTHCITEITLSQGDLENYGQTENIISAALTAEYITITLELSLLSANTNKKALQLPYNAF